ncbi:hypothetical protein G1C98_1038 [Bifidobacterium sp. DSM 109960]|uniref:Uncharacterized protein n=1 Tax=Bifidobacterium erythrocebi TaxID=2675325 RepID=A0A7Y0HVJ7_9BIFI|nr:hypothetical protein [Bifidobacterium sp. DSM 109960]NMM96302.1 hypothetical protein [Bifidobacterium sp. DSM 109960]
MKNMLDTIRQTLAFATALALITAIWILDLIEQHAKPKETKTTNTTFITISHRTLAIRTTRNTLGWTGELLNPDGPTTWKIAVTHRPTRQACIRHLTRIAGRHTTQKETR